MHVSELFVEQKQPPFGRVRIPGNIGTNTFFLTCITYDCLNDPMIISLLSRWRKENEYWFQAQFPMTDDRTKSWLQQRVLDVPDRILFLIDVGNHFVGHVGLFRYNQNQHTIDIDNIVRGETQYPGIMSEALRVLMNWGINDLGIKGYTLQTTSDNKKALAMYNRLGFSEVKRIPLVYTKTAEGGEWTETEDGPSIQRYEVFMNKGVI